MSTTGGKSEGVYVVSQAELDSGAFKLRPGPAIKVAGLQAGTRGVIAGPTTPVFVVSGSYERGVEGGNAVPVSVLTGIRSPVHDLAIPVYVESDDGQFAAPIEPPTPFWENLFAFYQLEEASGARVDEIAARNLAVVSTDPGQAAGKFDNAASFNETGYLQSADAGWQNWQSFSAAFWFYPADTGLNRIMSVYLSGLSGSDRSWLCYLSGSKLNFGVYRAGDGNIAPIATANTFPAANTWNFGAFRFDHTTRVQSVRMNDGAWAELVATDDMRLGAYPFNLGTNANALSTSSFNGRLDHTGIWKDYLLTDDDYDFLYNANVGATWAEIRTYGNAP